VVRWIQRRFDGTVGHPVRNARWGYGVAGVAVLVGLLTVPFLDASSSVTLKESDLLIHFDAPPGTSLPAMNEVTSAAIGELGQVPGVRKVSAHVGRAVHSDQVVNVNSGEIWVSLDPAADHDATIASMERVLSGYPEISHDVLTYTEERTTDGCRGPGEDGRHLRRGQRCPARQGGGGRRPRRYRRHPGPDDRAHFRAHARIEVDLDKAGEPGVKPATRRSVMTCSRGRGRNRSRSRRCPTSSLGDA
jgi:multidrug efflux pump subunit AcrB